MSCDFRKAARGNWGIVGRSPTVADIQLGALLRIADSAEAMSKNFLELAEECAKLKRQLEEERACIGRLVRSNAALRGAITRLKRRKK